MLEVMRDILQSRYLRSYVAHKQLARTSLSGLVSYDTFEDKGVPVLDWEFVSIDVQTDITPRIERLKRFSEEQLRPAGVGWQTIHKSSSILKELRRETLTTVAVLRFSRRKYKQDLRFVLS